MEWQDGQNRRRISHSLERKSDWFKAVFFVFSFLCLVNPASNSVWIKNRPVGRWNGKTVKADGRLATTQIKNQIWFSARYASQPDMPLRLP